jgi:hypothetical protein
LHGRLCGPLLFTPEASNGCGYGLKAINNNTMPHINNIYKNIDSIKNSPNVIDTLIEVDKILDRLDIYAYENWFNGEIVEGPFVERHWVDVTLMYPQKMMPNPDAAMRLIQNGCKVKYGKDVLETFKKVESADDLIETEDGQRLPKTVKQSVHIVNIRIPKQLLDVVADVQEIDDTMMDTVEQAYEDGMGGTDGLSNNDQGMQDEPIAPGGEDA